MHVTTVRKGKKAKSHHVLTSWSHGARLSVGFIDALSNQWTEIPKSMSAFEIINIFFLLSLRFGFAIFFNLLLGKRLKLDLIWIAIVSLYSRAT